MSHLDPLGIRRRLGRTSWGPPVPFGPDGWRYTHTSGDGHIIVTVDNYVSGHEWVHASRSRPDTIPTYDDLTYLYAAVFVDGWAYQVFAPPAEHVNIHERALHLFGRLDGAPALPDFTYGMKSI